MIERYSLNALKIGKFHNFYRENEVKNKDLRDVNVLKKWMVEAFTDG